jgi:hypothetical protein
MACLAGFRPPRPIFLQGLFGWSAKRWLEYIDLAKDVVAVTTIPVPTSLPRGSLSDSQVRLGSGKGLIAFRFPCEQMT